MTEREALKLALEALEISDEFVPVQEAITAIKEALEQPAQKESVRLRRGDILRCIETDELCTVWSTSTTGRTLIKWSEGSFGNYTAEQIGDLFWLEPEPDDLELAAEKSDNYAAFHAGYRFAVARSLAEQPAQQETSNESAYQRGYLDGMAKPCVECADRKLKEMAEQSAQQQEPVACIGTNGELMWLNKPRVIYSKPLPLYTTPPHRKPLSNQKIIEMYNEPRSDAEMIEFARAIEAAHGIKE